MHSRLWMSAVFLLATAPGASGQIQMDLRADTAVREERLEVRVSVTNRGREEARDVQIMLRDGSGGEATIAGVAQLPPGATHQGEAFLPLAGRTPGRHPLFVTAGYTDLNGYPFSAVLCALFSVQTETAPEVFGTLAAEPLADRGDVHVHLKNLAPIRRSYKLTIFAPREISINHEPEVVLEGGQETLLTLSARNFSALPGSRYPIYAVLESDRDGLHFTQAILGHLETVTPQGFVTRHRRWLTLAAAGLALLALWRAARALRVRRSGRGA